MSYWALSVGKNLDLFQDVSSQSTLGSQDLTGLSILPLECFPVLMKTSILIVEILAAYSFAVGDFVASIK